jgi:hypothetical protein
LRLRRLRLRLRRRWSMIRFHPARLVLFASVFASVLASLCIIQLASIAPSGLVLAFAQTDPLATPTASPLAPAATDPQQTATPGAETDPTQEAAPPCELPCLVSVAVSGSPVYQLASVDSPKLASFASGINLYAIGMDATTVWIELQIAPHTSAWIERNNLSQPHTLASLPVIATPVPRLITPTPAGLSLNAWVEYNKTDKSISIRIRGEGFRNNELVRFELYNPSGRMVQKQTDKGNVYNDVFAVFILAKYTGGTYKILVYRDDGAVLEKTVSVKEP